MPADYFIGGNNRRKRDFMKRTVSLIMVVLMCFSLGACKPKDDDSRKAIDAATEALSALHEVNSKLMEEEVVVSPEGEIMHNEWSLAYIAALEAYNALSDEEKKEVESVYCLEDNEWRVKNYEKALIEREIALYCKELAVEELKESLINKSSYEEYGWSLRKLYYFDEMQTSYHGDKYNFWVELEIEYSATNEMGGRIDDTEYNNMTGIYKDGTITINEE